MKLLRKLILLLVLMFSITASVILSKAIFKADGIIASVITVVPGENPEKEFRANWYSDYSNVKLYYTDSSDTTFANAKEVGECAAAYFGEPSTDWTPVGYDGKYRCQAEMDDLEPDTKYLYRIGNGTYTETRSFKTSGGSSALLAFVADPQQYSSGSPKTIWENHLDDLYYYAQSEYGKLPELLLGGGDMTNTGGNFYTWQYLFDNKYFYDVPVACSTGNHEYLDGNNGNLPGDARFYSAMYNNPKNGPDGKENISYWFKWNNVIIFVWDNIPKSESNYYKHYLWMKDVLEHNTYQFVIAMFHFPVYGGSSDSNLMTSYMRPLMEDLGIDLCLSGHDHSYKLTENYYNGKKSTVDGRGTYYLEVADTYTIDTNPVSALLNITDTSIVVKLYSSNRNYNGQFVINQKRTNNYADSSLDKDEFMSKLKIEANDNDYTQAFITVDKSGYGMVNTVKVYNGSTLLLDQWADSDLYNKYTIKKLTKDTDYNVKVVVSFKDGTEKETNIAFSTKASYGTIDDISLTEGSDKITLKFTPNLKPLTESVNVYVNGVLVENIAKSAKYVRISKDKLVDGENLIEFKAVDASGGEHLVAEYKYGEAAINYELKVDEKTIELLKDNKTSIEYETNGTVIFASNNEKVAKVSSSGEITAVGIGEALITITLTETGETKNVKVLVKEKDVEPEPEPIDPEPQPEDPIIEPEPVEPEPEPTPPEPVPSKKGCGSGSIQMVWYLTSAMGLVLVLRRRRYL